MPLTRHPQFDRTGPDPADLIVHDGIVKTVCWYWPRLRDDDYIAELCIANAIGPHSVESWDDDGQLHGWESYWEGELLIFRAHDSYKGGANRVVCWSYDRRLQLGMAAPLEQQHRLALKNRHSLIVPGLRNLHPSP
jgi:hypothetical protein